MRLYYFFAFQWGKTGFVTHVVHLVLQFVNSLPLSSAGFSSRYLHFFLFICINILYTADSKTMPQSTYKNVHGTEVYLYLGFNNFIKNVHYKNKQVCVSSFLAPKQTYLLNLLLYVLFEVPSVYIVYTLIPICAYTYMHIPYIHMQTHTIYMYVMCIFLNSVNQ